MTAAAFRDVPLSLRLVRQGIDAALQGGAIVVLQVLGDILGMFSLALLRPAGNIGLVGGVFVDETGRLIDNMKHSSNQRPGCCPPHVSTSASSTGLSTQTWHI